MLATRRSPRLVTLMFGALFIYLVALIFHLPTLFFLACCMAVSPVVSYGLAAAGLRTVSAERRVPPRLWPDEQVYVELRILNQAALPKALLLVEESLPEGLRGDPDEPPECVIPMLWGEPFVHRYPLVAEQRGRYLLPPVTARAIDTFDLFQARRAIGPPNEVVVYPRTVELGVATLAGAKLLGQTPDRRTSDGTDFSSTREYRPGDDLRRIHWPSTARLGKPIVVEYEQPTTANLFVVLDAGAAGLVGAGKDNTFETGVTVAASLIHHELDRGSPVGLYVAGAEPVYLPMTGDRSAMLGFLEVLALLEADARASLPSALFAAAELAPRGARLLVVSGQPRPETGGGELLGALAQVARRRPGLGYAYLDPRGYREVDAAVTPAAGFLQDLKRLGMDVYAVRRGDIARGLAAALGGGR